MTDKRELNEIEFLEKFIKEGIEKLLLHISSQESYKLNKTKQTNNQCKTTF